MSNPGRPSNQNESVCSAFGKSLSASKGVPDARLADATCKRRTEELPSCMLALLAPRTPDLTVAAWLLWKSFLWCQKTGSEGLDEGKIFSLEMIDQALSANTDARSHMIYKIRLETVALLAPCARIPH